MKHFRIIKTWIVDADSSEEAENKFIGAKNQNNFYEALRIEEFVMKPTLDEVIQHYKTGMKETDNCLVCSNALAGPYTEAPGQIRCLHCGVTYQIKGCHLNQEFMKKHDLKAEDIAQIYCDCYDYVPLLRAYWEEVHKRIPLGQYKTGGFITEDERNSFFGWLAKNSKKYKKVFTGFNWNAIEIQNEN